MRPVINIVVVFALCVPSTTHGWNAYGHRLVALIAWRDLDEDTRARIVEIIKANERFDDDFEERMPGSLTSADTDQWIFAQAAVWPDIIRDVEKFDRPQWHYINKPVFLSPADETVLADEIEVNLSLDAPSDAGFGKQKMNVIQAMKFAVSQLERDDIPDRFKATYMCWLFHLVGDVHQPLHSSALFAQGGFEKGDQGGNKIDTRPLGNPKKFTLHRRWDRLLGTSQQFNSARNEAAQLFNDNSALGEAAGAAMDFETWLDESHELAKSAAYTTEVRVGVREDLDDGETVHFRPSADYYQAAGVVAHRRAVEAGYRLAKLMKGLADEL